MNCPICYEEYSDLHKFFTCENFDNSFLYNDVTIKKCKNCGHLWNQLSKKEVAKLDDYYKHEHPKEGYEQLYSLPYEDNSLDEFHLDILEHAENPRRALEEVRRVLKEGGLCYITVPDADKYNDMYFWLIREHLQHFNIVGIKLIAQATGFELLSYEHNEVDLIGNIKMTTISAVFKNTEGCHYYCWGIGRNFMFLYLYTRLKYLELTLVDDTPEKQKETFKRKIIHSSDILKEADKNSFLLITANPYKELLKKKAKELGFKGEIIDV